MYIIETKKDTIKMLRAIAEAIVIIFLVVLVIRALTSMSKYEPYDVSDTAVVSGEDKGFIAVSYFGVDREGTDTLISTKQLDEQLKALNELGYVTISQQDMLNYFRNETPLPDKALFLMFEDGRRDTALFTDKLLEKYNYRASIFSYADKFAEKDPKFLSGKDLSKLEKPGYWEIGTNGYRLSYINCYDRYDRFLGQMTSDEFVRVNHYLGRDYNHYLMDYIRDENRVPLESSKEMEARITQDYNFMEQIYTEELGYVPMLYCLMHSNTGRFGNNSGVSAVNAENIENVFAMNFNRDGFSYNNRSESVYDLTRVQPQAYWSTNHLLMRIWDDLPKEQKSNIIFVQGKAEIAERELPKWTLAGGAAEYKKDRIILTSLPKAEAVLRLNDINASDFNVSVDLKGNKFGIQTIYLRTDEEQSSGLAVDLDKNELVVRELAGGSSSNELFRFDLHELTPIKDKVSVEEDMKRSLADEYKMRGRFANSATDSLIFYKAAKEAEGEATHSVEEGAEEYVPDMQINELGDTGLDIKLEGDSLHISVNGKDVTGDGIKTDSTGSGGFALGANWGGWGYSQRNVADDVYDGVYKNLVITTEAGTVYDGRLKNIEKIIDVAETIWTKILNWFITNL